MVFYGDLYITNFPFMGLEPLSKPVGITVTVIAMVGMINAINHSDGLDGLAGGESLLSLLVIAVLAYQADSEFSEMAVILACGSIGGILGFLRFNTHPAKVFMGDSGSQFLGFTLGFLAILLTQRVNTALSPAIPALILGLPVIDILAVFWLRASSGMNWFRATRNHIHHRLLNLEFAHHEAVVAIYTVQGIFVVAAVFLRYEADWLIVSVYLGVCALIFLSLTLAERSGWHVRRQGEASLLTRRIRQFRIFDVLLMGQTGIIGLCMLVYLIGISLFCSEVPRDFSIIAAVMFFVLGLELVSARRHNPVITRVISFATAVFVVYLGIQYPPQFLIDNVFIEKLFFPLLAGIVLFSVKYGRHMTFRTTPTDYLGLLMALALGFFPEQEFREIYLSEIVIKSVILFYGGELLLHRAKDHLNTLNLISLVALGILAMRGIL